MSSSSLNRVEAVRLAENFVRRAPDLEPQQAEHELLAVLRALYSNRFEIHAFTSAADRGIDFAVTPLQSSAGSPRFGLEFRHRKIATGVGDVHRVAGAATRNGFDSVVLLSSRGFTTAAKEAADRGRPRVQLLDFDGLIKLAQQEGGADSPPEDVGAAVSAIIQYASREFAKQVAANPRALDHIEWRDLERMMTEVLAGIGFAAELTPGAKDGGKDVILTLANGGTRRTFIVELKHWRSGTGVGKDAVKDFVEVVANEKRDGGLFLSTYGFTSTAFSSLTEVERRKIRFGEEEKIVELCKSFVKAGHGLWCPKVDLADTLFENTHA